MSKFWGVLVFIAPYKNNFQLFSLVHAVRASNICAFLDILTALLIKASLLRYDTVLTGFITDVLEELVVHFFWVVEEEEEEE